MSELIPFKIGDKVFAKVTCNLIQGTIINMRLELLPYHQNETLTYTIENEKGEVFTVEEEFVWHTYEEFHLWLAKRRLKEFEDKLELVDSEKRRIEGFIEFYKAKIERLSK